MNKTQKVLIVIASLFVLAWWFRYDTHCGTIDPCYSYDRFTGQWIFLYEETSKSINIKDNEYIEFKGKLDNE